MKNPLIAFYEFVMSLRRRPKVPPPDPIVQRLETEETTAYSDLLDVEAKLEYYAAMVPMQTERLQRVRERLDEARRVRGTCRLSQVIQKKAA